MSDLSAQHEVLKEKLARDRNSFFRRAWKDALSSLLSELNISASGTTTLVGSSFYKCSIGKWLKAAGCEPELIEHNISCAEDSLVWSVPESDNVFLFETLALVRNSSICLRKLIRLVREGGFVVCVTSVASDTPEYREKIESEFKLAGFEVLKSCVFFSRAFGKSSALQKNGPSVFSVLEDGRVILESPDCIPGGRVLESVAFNLVVAQRPREVPEKSSALESSFGDKGKIISADRNADYFLEFAFLKQLSPAIISKLEKCISTSFKNLKKGSDFDLVSGRSLYIKLPEPLMYRGGCVNALKIKGATFNSDEPFATFDEVPDSMLAFDRNGIFYHPNFDDKPMGSMTLAQAQNEFDIMSLALKRGINTDCPLGLVRYPDVPFQNRVTGSVIIGVEDTGVTNLFFDSFSRIFGEVSQTEDGVRISVDKKSVMKAAGALVKYGRALRRMHRSGIIHVLGHNRQLSLINGRFVFHDFEYSLSQSGMSRLQKAAYRLQDVRRCLFGLRIFRSRERLGMEFAHCFCQGYFGAKNKFTRKVDDKVIEDTLFKFYDPAAVKKDALIAWVLADI